MFSQKMNQFKTFLSLDISPTKVEFLKLGQLMLFPIAGLILDSLCIFGLIMQGKVVFDFEVEKKCIQATPTPFIA